MPPTLHGALGFTGPKRGLPEKSRCSARAPESAEMVPNPFLTSAASDVSEKWIKGNRMPLTKDGSVVLGAFGLALT